MSHQRHFQGLKCPSETSLRQFDTDDPPHDKHKVLQFNHITRKPEVGVLTALLHTDRSSNGRKHDKETVMSVKERVLFSVAIAILTATASLAEVKTDYDRTAQFSRYKTYSWG